MFFPVPGAPPMQRQAGLHLEGIATERIATLAALAKMAWTNSPKNIEIRGTMNRTNKIWTKCCGMFLVMCQPMPQCWCLSFSPGEVNATSRAFHIIWTWSQWPSCSFQDIWMFFMVSSIGLLGENEGRQTYARAALASPRRPEEEKHQELLERLLLRSLVSFPPVFDLD